MAVNYMAVPYMRIGNVAEKLVEEQPPERLRGSRVAGEQRPFDGLRQVDEREDGPIGVGEIRCERPGFVGRERFC
jgi:hypothetical protein